MAQFLFLVGKKSAHGLIYVFSSFKPWALYFGPRLFFRNPLNMNIVLIGYRCTGKTTVGKALARDLHRLFIDTDLLLEEKTGAPIDAIVAEKGWEGFRDLETEVVQEVSEKDNFIIATGGGIVLREANTRSLKANGLLVWLRAGAGVIRERMALDIRMGKDRPSLTGKNPVEEIKEQLAIRDPLYEDAGDLVVDTDHLSTSEVAEAVLRALSGRWR